MQHVRVTSMERVRVPVLFLVCEVFCVWCDYDLFQCDEQFLMIVSA